MGIMKRPAEVFLYGPHCTEDAVYIAHVNTSMVLSVLKQGDHTMLDDIFILNLVLQTVIDSHSN